MKIYANLDSEQKVLLDVKTIEEKETGLINRDGTTTDYRAIFVYDENGKEFIILKFKKNSYGKKDLDSVFEKVMSTLREAYFSNEPITNLKEAIGDTVESIKK
ncbi:hypothetical protein [uncultured Clostridium sp.]|uniref:hypothetical protein n=1 Tax=uncultured Clostridium sp. TaxID=59620 RepID=UPI0028EBC6E5|nr:hypothetical protein [uncultured Clostridium sp.]